jgi:hypothetical protein
MKDSIASSETYSINILHNILEGRVGAEWLERMFLVQERVH